MALTIGSLVGTLRADASAWERGLDRARLRLAGLTRDADGRLRDMNGRFVQTGDAAGRHLARGIRAGAQAAVGAIKKIAPSLLGIGVGIPAVAAVTTAIMGLAAGAVAAGLAVGAFTAAVKPQMKAVAEGAAAAEKADAAHEKVLLKKQIASKLAAKGGDAYKQALREVASASKAAKEADAAAEQQMKGMPKATRETAKALAGLKGDYKKWSDALSDDTMPIFTKGIGILRSLLPTLTPFVKAAAGALGDMLDRVATGVKSAKFKEWAADMSAAAGPALTNFITIIGNLGRGFMFLLQAFLPTSSGVTGGLASMTGAFASWAAGLKGSEGFAKFLEMARNGGGALGNLARAAIGLLVAISPLLGTTAMLANIFARIISQVPTDVLTKLGLAIAVVTIATKSYALATRLATVATAAWAAAVRAAGIAAAFGRWVVAAGRWVATMAVTVARTVAGWATMAASSVAAAARVAAAWAMMAARALVAAARMAASWLIALGPIGLIIAAVVGLVALIVANWDTVKRWTAIAWDWIWGKIKAVVSGILTAVGFLARLPGMVGGFFKRMGTLAINHAIALVLWLAGLPGRAVRALASLAGKLANVARSALLRFRNHMIAGALSAIRWLTGLGARIRGAVAGAARWLYNAGRSIIQGLINGIKNMAGAVGRAVSGVLSKARDLLPFSPAKKGPFSGKGWTLYSGQSMMTGLAKGIGQRQGLVTDAMARAAQAASGAIPAGMVGASPMSTSSGVGGTAAGRRGEMGVVRVDVQLLDDDGKLLRRIRRITKVNGRGNAQIAFGR